MLNPAMMSEDDMFMFRFFGILLGVAIRTKKPLDLYIAPPVWKQLAGMPLTADDLEEVGEIENLNWKPFDCPWNISHEREIFGFFWITTKF